MPHKQPGIQFDLAAIIIVIVGTIFGMIGGIARHLSDIQEDKATFSWLGLATQAIISSFAGSLATLYMIENYFSVYMIFIGAGLAGFGGVVLLRLVSNKIYGHFGGNASEEQHKNIKETKNE